MKLIDATNLKVGRMASYLAQEAIKGETVRIINADKAVFTGTKADILKRFHQKRKVGSRYQGPFYPKRADRIVKRVIRGMLPYSKARGRDAYKRVRAYIGVPEEFKSQKAETIEGAKVGAVENRLYMTVHDLSKHMGGSVMEKAPKVIVKEQKAEKPKEEKKVEGGKVEGSKKGIAIETPTENPEPKPEENVESK